jgi:hypothetical protein
MSERESPLPSFSLEQYPWILRFAYVFGIPALLSVYLIWLMSTRIETQLSAIEAGMMATRTDQAYMLKISGEQTARLENIYRLLQRICVNGATTPSDRASCFSTDRSQP